jgi:hypothetical protein
VALLCALAIALLAPMRAAAGEVGYEKWYVLNMNDQRAGHAVERQSVDEQGRISTATELIFRLQRLGQEIKIQVSTEFLETADGKPISMSTTQDLSLAVRKETYRFTDDGIVQESSDGERVTRKDLPLPEGEWLTPAKARDFVESRIAKGDDEITYRILDPTSGPTPVEQTHRIKGPRTVEVFGKTVPAIEWEVTQSALPGVRTTEFVDKRGVTVRSEINLGGMKMVMLEADKELALSRFSAPELMANTLVHPSRPIENPRDVKRAMYILSLKDGQVFPELPQGGAQSVERLDPQRVRVTVNLDHMPVAPQADIDDKRYIESSSTADAADPAIVELVRKALRGIPDDPGARAEALRVFAHHYIKDKSLGVGFASASEVCATREGDCSEHAVLLVAMLRAAGIPSRAVSGVVYVDSFVGERQVFGFHMWAQALIPIAGKPRWVNFDATMPDEITYDATHIALSTSSLADGDIVNSMASLVGLLGNLTIQVERVE